MRGKRILVVDDEEHMRNIFSVMLREEGHEVITAGNGEEGAALFKKYSAFFDFVITDFRMPKMNGIELIRFIKLQNNNKIKTILVSGDNMLLTEPVAKAAGADYVLAKPLDFKKFRQILKS